MRSRRRRNETSGRRRSSTPESARLRAATRGEHRNASARRGSGHAGAIIFGTIAVAVFAVVAYLLWPVLKPSGPASAGALTVQLSMGGFSPSRIQAKAGDPITLRFVNEDSQFHTDGGGWHQFAIDDLGVNVKVPPSKTQEFTFTPTTDGTFEFYCDVCCGGKENPSMVGTLTVTT